jgi:two-component system NtrC family response regulator
MQAHDWPGNIRELENFVERLSITSSGSAITAEALEGCGIRVLPESPENALKKTSPVSFPLDLDRRLEEVERQLILQALEQTGGVQVKAAELLNISERSIWHRIKKLGISILHKKDIT